MKTSWITLNLDDTIRVKLTKMGKQRLKKHLDVINSLFKEKPEVHKIYPETKCGYTELSLQELLDIYAKTSALDHLLRPDFVGNEIKVCKRS
jgi:hypothetical protein